MGVQASKYAATKVTKSVKNINVQNRAQKVMEQHKVDPKIAPKHPSTADAINRQVADHPEIKEELERKNTAVIGRVNQLHIEVTGSNPQLIAAKRPLPQNKKHIQDPLLLMENPTKVPVGKLSLTQIANILDKYKQSPNKYPAEMLAMTYKLDLHETENLLKYFYKLDLDEVMDNVAPDTTKVLPKANKNENEQLKIEHNVGIKS